MLRGVVVSLKTLLLFMLLYTSPAHGHDTVPLPREKPAHSLTTYRDLYVYVVHPHDFNKQRTVKCYSVGKDKYGYTVKIPCKEKEK
jgi:hypothetical protein